MILPTSLLPVLLLLFPQIILAQTNNSNKCSCFLTNGSSSGYFIYHRFHDYRNVADTSATIPAVLANITETTDALATSDFFTSDAFTKDWVVQNWNNSDSLGSNSSTASILMINSPNNVYIELPQNLSASYTTYLTLRTARLPTFQSAAEIDSTEQNFLHLSVRFLARVTGSPGACAGMFTYLPNNNPQDIQEADMEILTSGPRNMVQYTNQPSKDGAGNNLPQATVNSTNPGGVDWTVWNTYRVDWMPGVTSWYVNGESVANITFQAPRDPAGLIVNMWSDGGMWTGNMSTYDEAFLQIQWMELVYNTSDSYTGSGSKRHDEGGAWGGLMKRKGTPGCKVVCSVDEEVTITGTPALLYNNTGGATVGWKGEGMGAMDWIPLGLVGVGVSAWL